jgi:hypothetical protein
VIALLTVAGGTFLPAALRTADRAAVVGAREALAGMVARARSDAMVHGGARLRARAADAVVWIEANDSTLAARRLGEEFGVVLDLGVGDAELPFDALGIGRRASRTFVLRRRDAEARLVVAAYGRVVRS